MPFCCSKNEYDNQLKENNTYMEPYKISPEQGEAVPVYGMICRKSNIAYNKPSSDKRHFFPNPFGSGEASQ